jgi:hypothetical protein
MNMKWQIRSKVLGDLTPRLFTRNEFALGNLWERISGYFATAKGFAKSITSLHVGATMVGVVQ